MREIQILKEVKHPNIIALIDVFEDAKYLHLVTELCTGGELFDRIIAKTQSAEGHFSEHDASQLVRDILDAIAYCHDVKGIVHRDLKPENFLFLKEAEDAPIKIIDFGLSRHNDANQGIMKTKVDAEIFDSVRTGKFDFPSPEWDNISSTAKEFVRYLLQKDPKER
ncbi:MAG: hypothetical protein SGBAC_007766 [Bacillariaceae sp.]